MKAATMKNLLLIFLRILTVSTLPEQQISKELIEVGKTIKSIAPSDTLTGNGALDQSLYDGIFRSQKRLLANHFDFPADDSQELTAVDQGSD
jgi:hypothetical protein